MTGHPIPSSREYLQYQVDQLEKEYRQRWLTDPGFHARGRMVRNFLEQLESIHQARDTERVGFLIAALLDKTNPMAEAWERGMADAKLQAAGIRPLIRNPYLKEGA
jgi:hypothetical protein